MDYEIRRVPKNWNHPKDENGEYIPLLEPSKSPLDLMGDWVKSARLWEIDEPEKWHDHVGQPPLPMAYMPYWQSAAKTHYQMYISEGEKGVPLSPPTPSLEQLCLYLADRLEAVRSRSVPKEVGATVSPSEGWMTSEEVILRYIRGYDSLNFAPLAGYLSAKWKGTARVDRHKLCLEKSHELRRQEWNIGLIEAIPLAWYQCHGGSGDEKGTWAFTKDLGDARHRRSTADAGTTVATPEDHVALGGTETQVTLKCPPEAEKALGDGPGAPPEGTIAYIKNYDSMQFGPLAKRLSSSWRPAGLVSGTAGPGGSICLKPSDNESQQNWNARLIEAIPMPWFERHVYSPGGHTDNNLAGGQAAMIEFRNWNFRDGGEWSYELHVGKSRWAGVLDCGAIPGVTTVEAAKCEALARAENFCLKKLLFYQKAVRAFSGEKP